MDRKNICRRSALRIAVWMSILVLLMAQGAGAATITVDDSGGADYTRIQDAVNVAMNGDTILVYNGTYNENIILTSGLTIKSYNGPSSTIVQAANPNDHVFVTSNVGNKISGFTIKGATGSGSYAGIRLQTGFNNVSSNIIYDNMIGITIMNSNNNTISDNSIYSTQNGIFVTNGDFNLIFNNSINSTLIGGIRIFEWNSENNIISDNLIDSTSNYGIEIGSGDNIVKNNRVINNKYGIRLSYSNNNTIFNNYFNNTNNFLFSGTNSNIWNTTKTSDINIIDGFFLGGNFWAYPNGTGFSQTCTDANRDGICDSAYVLNLNNIDFLPLAAHDAPLDTWRNMNPATHPSARQSAAMAYDSTNDRIVLFGGLNFPDGIWTRLDDTWAYDSESNIWTNLNPTTYPSARYGHGMAYDNESDRVIIFGGWIFSSIDETWAYDFRNNTWMNMNPATHPPRRTGNMMMMTYDVQSDRIILFGGQQDGGGFQNYDDTWAYNFNTNTWTNMNPATHPSARTGYTMAYDVESDKIILFGGGYNEATQTIEYNDTWAYDFNTNTWTNMNPTTRPSARLHHAMTYDVQRDSTIIFGGTTNVQALLSSETWAYDFNTNTWTNMSPAIYPSARHASMMAYDNASHRTILFGGGNFNDVYNDTWSYPIRYINGTVIDSITKDVLAGVSVSTTEASTTSNASGFYSLAVTSGTYHITTKFAPIYYTNSTTVSTAFNAVVVQDIELIRKPTGNITGIVSIV